MLQGVDHETYAGAGVDSLDVGHYDQEEFVCRDRSLHFVSRQSYLVGLGPGADLQFVVLLQPVDGVGADSALRS